MARLPPLLVLPGVAGTPLAAISALDPSTRTFGCIFPSPASLVLSFFVNFFFWLLIQLRVYLTVFYGQRIDIGVVTRMAKFITISLLAYAAAFLFFTPVRAGRHNQDDICIQDMMAAAENPDRGIHPLSPIRDRMKDIFITTSTSPAIQCSMGEVLATPENIPKKRFAILRSVACDSHPRRLTCRVTFKIFHSGPSITLSSIN
ncbi:hypothetical protein SeMB42_g06021 [Synchytrium endobioticum]|uniref:Uncharacterized protein n=1 Tax=Synchytrium endobioticum TaxID=286115 RepID=A0A507CFY4_9FUNG|nr:hypothetical protein SeMB42_g06021 [Synchytrium endobioticum]